MSPKSGNGSQFLEFWNLSWWGANSLHALLRTEIIEKEQEGEKKQQQPTTKKPTQQQQPNQIKCKNQQWTTYNHVTDIRLSPNKILEKPERLSHSVSYLGNRWDGIKMPVSSFRQNKRNFNKDKYELSAEIWVWQGRYFWKLWGDQGQSKDRLKLTQQAYN